MYSTRNPHASLVVFMVHHYRPHTQYISKVEPQNALPPTSNRPPGARRVEIQGQDAHTKKHPSTRPPSNARGTVASISKAAETFAIHTQLLNLQENPYMGRCHSDLEQGRLQNLAYDLCRLLVCLEELLALFALCFDRVVFIEEFLEKILPVKFTD